MKKQTGILLMIVIVLVVVVGVFAFLNRGNVADKQRLEDEALFKVTKDGETLCEVSMADLDAIGQSDVPAVMDTSTTDPTDVTFTGAQVKDILAYKGVSVDGVTTIEFRALDGYASAITPEEIQMDENVYICTKMGGEALGTKSEGGMGPYLMIIRSAQYSQRWCKFLEEIVLI